MLNPVLSDRRAKIRSYFRLMVIITLIPPCKVSDAGVDYERIPT